MCVHVSVCVHGYAMHACRGQSTAYSVYPRLPSQVLILLVSFINSPAASQAPEILLSPTSMLM